MKDAPAILLVDPSGPRNVGAVARAMANFGASDLRVVGRHAASLLSHEEAIATAMGGRKILTAAATHARLAEATDGLDVLVGATKRPGRRRAPILTPWSLAATIIAGRRKVGITLGNEVRGLSRVDLRGCEFLVRIPAVPPVDSLNQSSGADGSFRRAETLAALALARFLAMQECSH